jgi:hypothetical protein
MNKRTLMVVGCVALVGVGGAVIAGTLTFRLAAVTLDELRALRVTVLEVKRRMSVARTETGERVSFDAGGDPEGYGEAKRGYMGPGDLLAFLRHGLVHDA